MNTEREQKKQEDLKNNPIVPSLPAGNVMPMITHVNKGTDPVNDVNGVKQDIENKNKKLLADIDKLRQENVKQKAEIELLKTSDPLFQENVELQTQLEAAIRLIAKTQSAERVIFVT